MPVSVQKKDGRALYCIFIVINLVTCLALDMYDPAIPIMKKYFHVMTTDIQLTISIYLLMSFLG